MCMHACVCVCVCVCSDKDCVCNPGRYYCPSAFLKLISIMLEGQVLYCIVHKQRVSHTDLPYSFFCCFLRHIVAFSVLSMYYSAWCVAVQHSLRNAFCSYLPALY